MNIKRIYGSLLVFLVILQISFMSMICTSSYPISDKLESNSDVHPSQFLQQSINDNVSIFNHRMEIFIQSDTSLRVESTLVIENHDNDSLEYFVFCINETVSSVFVEDPIGSLTFGWLILNDSSVLNITMRYPLIQNNMYVFSISYEVYNRISILDQFSLIEITILHLQETLNFYLLVHLPLNYELITGTSPLPYFPLSAKVYTKYNILIIEWELEDVNLGFEYFYIIRYKEKISDFHTNPEPNTKLAYLYAALAFIVGILLSSSVFFLIIKRKYQPARKKLVSTLLSDSEQAVIKAINDEGGVAIQRRICERTGFSKSKVSQILLKLEEKDVLKRERWGRTNRVTITNESFLNIDLDDSDKADVEKE